MRNVLRNANEVFHYWANEVQESGRSGNVSFDRGEVYSYAACIGNLIHREIEGDDAPRIIVLTADRTWSVTTTGHQSNMRSAAGHLKQVAVLTPRPRSANDHRLNLDHIAGRIEESLGKAKRARQNKAWHEAAALRRVEEFNLYAAFFGLEARFQGVGDAAAYMADVERRRAEIDAKAAEERRLREEANRVAAEEELVAWRKHESAQTGHYFINRLTRPALRVSKDGSRIETTMGAEIPVKHALRLWTLVKLARERGGYVPGTQSAVSLGVYQLTRISPQGDVVAGCHDIPYSEIEGIARVLGLLEEVSA